MRPIPSARRSSAMRTIGILMALAAVSLAIASTLHLAGLVHGRSAPFNGTHAGIAEAIIGTVLAAGSLAVLLAPDRARTIALAVTAFATAGFIVGLNFTVRNGHLPDVVYHVALLPVFIGSFVELLRVDRAAT
jgi:hypothetical protein